ncbi:hypothetical protein LTR36_007553 [Oleoguttula mirabilis]|uniref:Major facilitator superfamily (MFS) profile domain-containing protein n=1 Tax=Oleoguttula mirabilis TaxID=1507867 RepID=A0AAV9JVQ8_9PEZI|nr:hypothetical protein LTR36_007553 [Oleoguttula mirabilis]
MDTHIADEKLKELHIEEVIVKANDKHAERYDIDPEAEKKLLRKIDFRLIPPLWLLFMLAFLDRTNIGNARIQGMTKDLKMEGNDYNIALFIFFIPYILFEVPSNILIKRMKPSTWLSGLMFCWGIVTIGQGLVTTTGGLQAMRFLLGCMYLISMYYKRYELQRRFSVFFTGSILAGSFSGLLAYAISHMDGVGGYAGWRWIFILEGLVTAVIGLASKWFIADWPEDVTFLTDDEKTLLIARLTADVADAKMNRLDKPAAKRIFTDWKMYCGVFMYMGVVNTGYATSFFLPTIITELGFKAEAAQPGLPIFSDIVTIAWVNNTMGGHYRRSISSAVMIGFGNIGGIIASNIFITSQAPAYPVGYGVSLGLLWMCALACTGLLLGLRAENKRRDRGERDWRLETEDADNLGDDHPHFRFTY